MIFFFLLLQNLKKNVLGLVLLGFVISLVHAHGFLLGQVIGMLARITMSSAIYNKVIQYIHLVMLWIS